MTFRGTANKERKGGRATRNKRQRKERRQSGKEEIVWRGAKGLEAK